MTLLAFHLEPLAHATIEELFDYWVAAHPLHPMAGAAMLHDRLFVPGPNPDELMWAARSEQGELIGLAIGVHPLPGKPETEAGLRWLGVRPEWLGSGLPAALALQVSRALVRRGARKVTLHAIPPPYLRPGIDIRETGLITALLQAGWQREGVNFNMTVDLTRWEVPLGQPILGPAEGGYLVRRAEAADRARLAEHARAHWSQGWVIECDLAFLHAQPTAFIAEKDGEIVGFSCYEVGQAMGNFGPTGVLPEHRKGALGRRLLWACLAALQAAGRPVCEIGWIGPVPFYFNAAGAILGPTYWALSHEFEPEEEG